jgi:hypothetical protein
MLFPFQLAIPIQESVATLRFKTDQASLPSVSNLARLLRARPMAYIQSHEGRDDWLTFFDARGLKVASLQFVNQDGVNVRVSPTFRFLAVITSGPKLSNEVRIVDARGIQVKEPHVDLGRVSEMRWDAKDRFLVTFDDPVMKIVFDGNRGLGSQSCEGRLIKASDVIPLKVRNKSLNLCGRFGLSLGQQPNYFWMDDQYNPVKGPTLPSRVWSSLKESMVAASAPDREHFAFDNPFTGVRSVVSLNGYRIDHRTCGNLFLLVAEV